MSARSLFVTGTDTGIGKTLASAALLHALRARGLRATGMKPVASGCARTAAGWRNDDALSLQAASDPCPAYTDVNPYPLPEPTAPQLAARAAGVTVALDVLLAAHGRLAARCDVVVVEGAGGWLAPLADGLEHAGLARALDAEVVLVVGLRLGCLNHARLTARAVAADGARLAGWIGSTVDPDFDRRAGYLGLVAEALPVPCWGVLPHRPAPDPREAAAALRLPDERAAPARAAQ
ncbi:dethiobiotin synthase [Luteimonas sp. Y-2-2-4F]|nr:dethiobiotin synthase [Luteimonas sp. Y-2-2-4F]MCD9033990.1 dethiobiotin synthase [Luteimonas sp. Y-2-2-4F]